MQNSKVMQVYDCVDTLGEALCSDKDQFGVLIACEHRYIGEAHDVLGHSNKARDTEIVRILPDINFRISMERLHTL